MKVLHVCNDFAGSKVHVNLTKQLDDKDIGQVVYCPVRDKQLVGKNKFDGKHIEFIYSFCIKSWYKYVYHYKAFKLYKDLKRNVDLSSVNIIHAHTLFSDGVLAYKAHKEFGLPYVVAVRNTDVNDYIRLMRHCYHTGREILLNAEKVFFISAALKKKFEESKFVEPILEKVKHKFVLQPNGIDDYWHEHISHEERHGHDVLYVGDFSANKNVVRLAEAIIELRKEDGFNDVRLKIVGGEVKGGGRKNDGQTQAIIIANPKAINSLGKIYDKDKLSEVMRSCSVFAMPSIYETFGLVYLEALSQNLPIIYTKEQGVDGMFDDTIGIGVNPLSIEEIKKAIKIILQENSKYGNLNVHFEDFKWREIASKYICMYKHIITQ